MSKVVFCHYFSNKKQALPFFFYINLTRLENKTYLKFFDFDDNKY